MSLLNRDILEVDCLLSPLRRSLTPISTIYLVPPKMKEICVKIFDDVSETISHAQAQAPRDNIQGLVPIGWKNSG